MTIHARVAAARERLLTAGLSSADAHLDARLLAEFVLDWDTARFLTAGHEAESADFAARYDAAIARRVRREPLAYITGRREFWNLAFEVSPAVLIPRPETELVVEAALELFPPSAATLEAADVCTGSGCLAVALAHERPQARIVATDVSGDALVVARRNADRHGVAGRITFVQTDVLQEVAGGFDLIVSNPPYVSDGHRSALMPEVRDYEPPVALFGGQEGLTILERVVRESVPRLNEGGWLILEFGFWQETSVQELIDRTPGLTLIAIKSDLQGVPRMALAKYDKRS